MPKSLIRFLKVGSLKLITRDQPIIFFVLPWLNLRDAGRLMGAVNNVLAKRFNINMNIWIDADACPKAIKAVLFKAAERRQSAYADCKSVHAKHHDPKSFVSSR